MAAGKKEARLFITKKGMRLHDSLTADTRYDMNET
jgi:hypothetical protein